MEDETNRKNPLKVLLLSHSKKKKAILDELLQQQGEPSDKILLIEELDENMNTNFIINEIKKLK